MVSVLVNGNLTNKFNVGRELTKGDPFPSFLLLSYSFIIHLQFVDDTFIIRERTSKNVRVGSSLKVNFNKSILLGIHVNNQCCLRKHGKPLKFIYLETPEIDKALKAHE
ncbi:hypothetical protein CR513_53934, partial [Mucuna pruriens]